MPDFSLEPEDQALIAAARLGDRLAMGRLLTRHQSRMFGLCYRIVHHREMAADLCQDAMVKVIQHLNGYDGRAQFTTWMTRIVINVCLSKLRSEKLRRHASLDGSRGSAGWDRESGGIGRIIGQSREPSVAERVEDAEVRRDVEAALAILDPEQRTILLLRDQRGLDYDEIAEVLGIAVGTVKSRLFRARAALREALAERVGQTILGAGEPGVDRGRLDDDGSVGRNVE